MSKSQFTQSIRNEYKQQTRYIRIKAELDLGGTRPSVNLLPTYTTTKHSTINGNDITLNINNWDCTLNGYATSENFIGWFLSDAPTFTLPAGTYTLTLIQEVSKGNQTSKYRFTLPYLKSPSPDVDPYWQLWNISTENGPTTEKLYISQTKTLEYEQTIGISQFLDFGVGKNENVNQVYNENFKLMLNEGTEMWPWWEGGSSSGLVNDVFTLGEDGICQIIDFNVDETTDIYYEKMPYSELTITVDNSKGYFSDFGENSIVKKLTKDVKMNFYLNINDTGWIKTWTMQFDSLKADNDRAKLTFKPYCISIFNSEIHEGRLFSTQAELSYTDLQYIIGDYHVNLYPYYNVGSINTNDYHILKNVSDLLIAYAGDLTEQQQPQLLAITDNQNLTYKRIQYNSKVDTPHADENLLNNELLEKPIVTKEELQELIINYKNIIGLSQSTSKFQKTITFLCEYGTETLVIFCDNLDANGITENDITLTNANLEWLGVSYDELNIASRYLLISISCNPGEECTININANLQKIELNENQVIHTKRKNVDKDSIMQIDGFSNGLYWETLKSKMSKKIKLKTTALPYLQVGDCITFEEEGKTPSLNDKVVITEIHTTWESGFKMEIIAYKVYDINPDGLIPNNNLYPSDELYSY